MPKQIKKKSHFFDDITYESSTPIGQGSWGKVYSACHVRNGKCNVAIKHVQNSIQENVDQYDRNYYTLPAYREIAIYQYLAKTRLTPKLLGWDVFPCSLLEAKGAPPCEDGVECSQTGCTVVRFALEKFEGNVEFLMQTWQEEEDDQRLIIRKDVLEMMFRIARELGQNGIIHGDLKPDQFLYRYDPRTNKYDIRVIDFGFAGAVPTVRAAISRAQQKGTEMKEMKILQTAVTDPWMGWPSLVTWPFHMIPHEQFHLSSIEEAITFNLWNLYLYFLHTGTFIVRSTKSNDPGKWLGHFLGLRIGMQHSAWFQKTVLLPKNAWGNYIDRRIRTIQEESMEGFEYTLKWVESKGKKRK